MQCDSVSEHLLTPVLSEGHPGLQEMRPRTQELPGRSTDLDNPAGGSLRGGGCARTQDPTG